MRRNSAISRWLWLFAGAVIIAACAQAYAPTGGDSDRDPPLVVETNPEPGAVLSAFTGEVKIKFDETISERGPRVSDLVAVSPQTGEVEVHRKGRELRIKLKGGWQSGRVYHVTVFPGLQDRRGNARRSAYDLVFSTGPEIPPSALGGIVNDRLTGRPVTNARVIAVSTQDTTAVYTTLTDTAGFFALRSLPVGEYQATAFVDQDRNRKPNGREALSVLPVAMLSPTDTLSIEFFVLAPDSTPARLLKAEARDSQQIRLTFDDFIDAAEPLGAVTATLLQLPDSAPLGGGIVLYPREFDARERAAKKDSTEQRPAPAVAAPTAAADTTRVLPVQELVLIPTTRVISGRRYVVVVRGVRNISNIENGGGAVSMDGPPRARPAATDSTAAPAPQDSTVIRR